MKSGYFPTLLACGGVSILLLVVATWLSRDVPWLAIIAGCLPLVYYHLAYLWPRAKTGLSQAAVDSVYYFGFLVTLAALSISAVSIALEGASANLVIVVYQFGAGLAATGYAVFARMHLSSLATMLDSTSPEAVMDRYLQTSMRLVDNAEAACSRLAEFSKKLVQQSSELETVTKQRMERIMLETAGAFARELTSALAEARTGLVEVRSLANDLTFAATRVELSKAINDTLMATNHVTVAMEELAQKSESSTLAMSQHASVTQAASTAMRTLEQDVGALAGPQGTLPKSTASLQTASDALKTGSKDLTEAMALLREVRDATSEALPAFKGMRTLAKKAHDQIDTLSQVTERFGTALESLTPASDSAVKLADALEQLASAGKIDPLALLVTRAEGLQSVISGLERDLGMLSASARSNHEAVTQSTASVKTAIGSSADLLKADVERSGQAVTLLIDRLTQVAQTIIDRTRQQKGLPP